MLRPGRIPLLPGEEEAVERLLAKHPGSQVTLTRRDAGERGPVLAHIGDETWQIGESGRARRVR